MNRSICLVAILALLPQISCGGSSAPLTAHLEYGLVLDPGPQVEMPPDSDSVIMNDHGEPLLLSEPQPVVLTRVLEIWQIDEEPERPVLSLEFDATSVAEIFARAEQEGCDRVALIHGSEVIGTTHPAQLSPPTAMIFPDLSPADTLRIYASLTGAEEAE